MQAHLTTIRRSQINRYLKDGKIVGRLSSSQYYTTSRTAAHTRLLEQLSNFAIAKQSLHSSANKHRTQHQSSLAVQQREHELPDREEHFENFLALMHQQVDESSSADTDYQQQEATGDALSLEEGARKQSRIAQELMAPSLMDLMETYDPDNPPSRDDLHALQLWYECQSHRETVLELEAELNSARERHDYTSISAVKRQLLYWYTPFKEAIEEEQLKCLNGEKGIESRQGYAPFLLTLKADKLAIIVTHEVIGMLLRSGGGAYEFKKDQEKASRGGGVKLITLAMKISDAVEAEVAVERVLVKLAEDRKQLRQNMWKPIASEEEMSKVEGDISDNEDDHAEENEVSEKNKKLKKVGSPYSSMAFDQFLPPNDKDTKRSKMNRAKAKAKYILQNDYDWPANLKVKFGVILLQMLMNTAKMITPDEYNGQPAIDYEKVVMGKTLQLQGYVSVNERLYQLAVEEKFQGIRPFATRYQPMIVPPDMYTSPNRGGYKALDVDVMRTAGCKEQKNALRRTDLGNIYQGLDALAKVPWVIQKENLDVAQRCWDEGVVIGDIPQKTDFEVPEAPERPPKPENMTKEHPEYEEYRQKLQIFITAASKYRKAVQKNMDLRSLRCSALLKFEQADKFKDFEEIFFPYNLDFRGRVYPIPPHLNHLGSDLSRGLLTFAEAKPLGDRGLYWLKVHLANLAGADKMSFDDRVNYAESNMDNIRSCAEDPFAGERWWMSCEYPFQALATCREIVRAIDSGDPSSYMSSLPVHMDGSCNGLQHYAALGLDVVGGKAVNLIECDEPQDVYIGVMEEVIRRVDEEVSRTVTFDPSQNLSKREKDAMKRNKAAKLVYGSIDRGVVKRTVMTSVYGVTFIGARNQIKEKIEEKLKEKGENVEEMEDEIYSASSFLASVTMEVMGDLFTGARQTQNWLTDCARLISSMGHPVAWVTPLGVPAIQPYRHKKLYSVRTILQRVSLALSNDDLPIHKSRQVSAFPPNYVHSLDATHMLMTGMEMDKRGLTFTAVHDSFWTHASDIDEMNSVLRNCFVDLYSQPLLEELKKTWELRYPDLEFPPVPEKGDMDLRSVLNSSYFFQ